MAQREFRLPDLGEGLAEAEIVHWLVAVGDRVEVNQPLAEVETAKAVVELPSPFAGQVVSRYGEQGDTLSVGSVLVTIDDGQPAPATVPAPQGAAPAAGQVPPTAAVTPPAGRPAAPPGTDARHGAREPMLVGYGPRDTGVSGRGRRRRHPGGLPPTAAGDATALLGGAAGRHAAPVSARRGDGPALAKPPVRRLARDLGVDLGQLSGTGPAGTISRSDVEAAAQAEVPVHAAPPRPSFGQPPLPGGPTLADLAEEGRVSSRVATPAGPAGPTAPVSPPAPHMGEPAPPAGGGPGRVGQIPVGSTYDEVSRTWAVPVSSVRRATARAMVSSAFTAPHVTEFVSVDLTETMALRDRVAALPDFADLKVTPLLFVARALLVAVRRHPMINASWVEDGVGDPRIVAHQAVNLGIAVASPRGLLVPNIPDADRLDLACLARGLQDLTQRTRAGQARPADLTGGTITITNIGVFGVDIGTPILNPGEAAILAVGAIRQAPWVHDGELAVRWVGQLALSFDHRLVDGELGSVVLADIAAMLADPSRLLAWS